MGIVLRVGALSACGSGTTPSSVVSTSGTVANVSSGGSGASAASGASATGAGTTTGSGSALAGSMQGATGLSTSGSSPPIGNSGAPSTSGGSAGASAGAAVADAGVQTATSGGDGDATVTTSGLPDPGATGDGDFTIGPQYTPDPLNFATSAPRGRLVHYQMLSSQSTIYPGLTGPYTRDVMLYVPQQYVAGTPAPFIVVQDGVWAVWLGRNIFTMPDASMPAVPGTANLPVILDNLIAAKKLPTLAVLFVGNGGGDYIGSERGLEYDTVSGLFAEFIEKEALPRAVMEAQSQLGVNLVFTSDPQGRMTLGGSSGGAASFSMAWWHPEYFNRVVTFSGTFVNQVPASSPFPHGCWVYHDVDPYDASAPNGLIVQHCAGQWDAGCATPLSQAACGAAGACTWNTSVNQPLRMWLETGQNDNGAGSGPYRDFRLANQRMAAALKLRGYHYHFDYALGAGHLDGNVVEQTLPSALLWVWRGYPIP